MSPFQLHYLKTKPINLQKMSDDYIYEESDLKNQYNPFRISQFQQYNPLYSQFFELNPTNYNSISLNHNYHIHGYNSLIDASSNIYQKDIHIKFSPLLDPVRYLCGKYDNKNDNVRTIPTLDNTQDCFHKLSDKYNMSYVDAFFCYLSCKLLETHNFFHGIEFYGSFLGVQELYKFNATDDFDYLCESSYFMKHMNNEFICDVNDDDKYANFGSRGNKQKLNIADDEVSLSSICSFTSLKFKNNDIKDNVHNDNLYEVGLDVDDINESGKSNIDEESVISISSHSECSNDSKVNYSSEDDESNQDGSADNNECGEEESIWDEVSESTENTQDVSIYIKNFPIQMICMEKYHGTLDELFERGEVDSEIASAYLLQVIMTLIVYQRAFKLTHNDLHSNNIMYLNTDIKYLYYLLDGKYYKVPTYGKIFKIIDFGRAWYTFRGMTLCSDSFAPGGDAYTQYNYEPMYNPDKRRIPPNFSFDLCRLGSSLYGFIFPNDIPEESTMSELQKTVYRWCLDDNGKDVMYKKNGEERYPGFKLYSMIARTVHNHTPEKQLEYKYFNQYIVSPNELCDIDMSEAIKHGINIDKIHEYYAQ
jgi:hypothetical protein